MGLLKGMSVVLPLLGRLDGFSAGIPQRAPELTGAVPVLQWDVSSRQPAKNGRAAAEYIGAGGFLGGASKTPP